MTLDAAFAAVARVRRAPALHPRGEVFTAELTLPEGWPGPVTVPVRRQVVVRMSKGGGLPGRLPDVLGLAMRVPDAVAPGLPVDILLSTSGRGLFSRWVPVPRGDWAAAYGSIMPFRSGTSLCSLAAVPEHCPGLLPSTPAALVGHVRRRPFEFTLFLAAPMRDWQPFGRLSLTGHQPSARISFDPVLNAHPHLLPVPQALAVARKVAYEGSRRGDPARTPQP